MWPSPTSAKPTFTAQSADRACGGDSLACRLRLLASKMLPEESKDIGVKFLVEGNAVETRSIDANPGKVLRFLRRARRQEGEVDGIRCDVVVWLRRKPVADPGCTAPGNVALSKFWVRTPQLDRDGHRLQIVRRENEGGSRIDDDGGSDAWIMCWRA